MHTKRMLFICQRPPYPPNKGEKLRTYHQIRVLAEQGHRIHVACPTTSQQDSTDLQALLNTGLIQSVVHQPLRLERLRKPLALLSRQSISEFYFYSRSLQQKINLLISQHSIDTVVCTASSLANYATPLPDTLDKYMDFMDLDSDKWQQYAEQSPWPLRWVYEREAKKVAQLEKHAGDAFNACYFISDNEIALYQQIAPAPKAHVFKVGNGIDEREFYPASSYLPIANNAPVLLFVGVMDYKPNVDAVTWFAEHCWPQVKQQYPNAQFNIVGMNPSKAVLALAQQAGIQVTGKVDDVLPYFHQAHIFVAPFRIARGVQNKVLQAFACGLPVVSTAMGLEGIQGNTAECALTAQQPNDWLHAINTLVQQPALHQSMHQAGIALIQQHYSWHAALNHFVTSSVASHLSPRNEVEKQVNA